MLTIHMAGFEPDDSAGKFFYDGTITELFRRVSVQGGQVVFVEVSPGHLLNLAEVLRIVDEDVTDPLPDEEQALADDVERIQVMAKTSPAVPIPGGPPSCPHGFIRGTCSLCTGMRP